jgi:hypothetical protein
MMADGLMDVKPLISHNFAIEDAEQAYALVGGTGPSLGILLTYPGIKITPEARTVALAAGVSPHSQQIAQGEMGAKCGVSFIGAGNYATAVLIPAFKASGVLLRSVASSAGVSGLHAGRKFGFEETTTDTNRLFADVDTNAVVITTQHDSHARFVLQALAAGKHVFVEKPLCLTLDELKQIEAAAKAHGRLHGDGGFNRRFAPQVQKISTLLKGVNWPQSLL